MSKFNFAVYPAIATLSLAAAFSAHAQSVNDQVDQAAYGPTPVATSSAATAAIAKYAAPVAKTAASSRTVRDFDAADRAGYGPMVVNTASVRTRAEVRAEAVAAMRAAQ